MSGERPRPAEAADRDMDRKILELFRSRSGGFVSGEVLSTLLGVSRTAVWKHIKNLKNLGYRIESVPSRGYRLVASPDILTPAEISAGLAVRRIGTHVVCFRETGSTNTVASQLAAEGAAEGTVVLADAQTGGKGRLGRRWESPPGVNVYCSVILRPPSRRFIHRNSPFCRPWPRPRPSSAPRGLCPPSSGPTISWRTASRWRECSVS